jgi:cytochrome c553
MLKTHITLITLLVGSGIAIAEEHAAESHGPAAPVNAEELSKTCAACHGADGNETLGGTFPRIAGQYESYLDHAIKEYRSGRRENAIMGAQAANLSDEDIAALAAWYSHLPGRVGTVRKN